MVDKLSDFFKEIKERISNPLLSSFALSWMFCNWKIVIALLSYQREDYKELGFKDFVEYFKSNSTDHTLITWPLVAAALYTFAFPFLRNWILIFNAWIKRWGNDYSLEAAKKGTIQTSKYLELREQYQTQIKQLSEIIKSESVTLDNNRRLIEENGDLLKYKSSSIEDLGKLEHEISELKQKNDLSSTSIENLRRQLSAKNDFIDSGTFNGVWYGTLIDNMIARDIKLEINTNSIILIQQAPNADNRYTFNGEIKMLDLDRNNRILQIVAFQHNDLSNKQFSDPLYYPYDIRLFEIRSSNDIPLPENNSLQNIICDMNGWKIKAERMPGAR